MREFIKQRLNEELTKSDVKDEVKRAMDSKALEDKIGKVIKAHLRNNPELEKKMMDISKDVLKKLYQALWTRHSTWLSAIK